MFREQRRIGKNEAHGGEVVVAAGRDKEGKGSCSEGGREEESGGCSDEVFEFGGVEDWFRENGSIFGFGII